MAAGEVIVLSAQRQPAEQSAGNRAMQAQWGLRLDGLKGFQKANEIGHFWHCGSYLQK
jgi:hypothetical protein